MKKKTIALWAAAVAGSICLSALSGAYAAEAAKANGPATEWRTAEQTLAEFKEIEQTTQLALPDGVAWPHIPPADLSDTEGLFEVGYIESTTNLYWLCAWEEALVEADAVADARGASNGRAAIASFAQSKWFVENDVDPNGFWRDKVLKTALKGDLSGVKAEVANCGYFHQNQ